MTTRWARFARGWVVAVFATLVAALSHTLGGGTAPSALAVVVSLAFAGMICVVLAGRTVSTLRLTLSIVISQVIFHLLFSFGGAGGALTVDAAATGPHGGHSVSVVTVGAGEALAHVGHAGWTMWLAHLLAAVVTIVALRRGEQAFWGLVANARLSIRSCAVLRGSIQTPVAVPAVLRCAPMVDAAPAPRDLGVFLVTRPHRGPPVYALCA